MAGHRKKGIDSLREVLKSTTLKAQLDAENEEDAEFQDDCWILARMMGWRGRVNQSMEEEEHVWRLGTPELRHGHAEFETPEEYVQISAGRRSSRQLHVPNMGISARYEKIDIRGRCFKDFSNLLT